jgi:Arc/MetJ family transcription regulator
MRTNIAIDDDLINEALVLTQLKTKKAVVETALKLLVRMEKQHRIRQFRGKLTWEGNLDDMRSDA